MWCAIGTPQNNDHCIFFINICRSLLLYVFHLFHLWLLTTCKKILFVEKIKHSGGLTNLTLSDRHWFNIIMVNSVDKNFRRGNCLNIKCYSSKNCLSGNLLAFLFENLNIHVLDYCQLYVQKHERGLKRTKTQNNDIYNVTLLKF